MFAFWPDKRRARQARAVEEAARTFEGLCELSSNRSIAPDDDILEAIRSGSRPAEIREARHLFGSNSPGVFGLIIEEAGKRQLKAAAPLITEYCAWPRDDDFWGHVVPKACRALKNIGDLSCVVRMEEIASLEGGDEDLLRSTIRTLTEHSPSVDPTLPPEEAGPLSPEEEGTTILSAYEYGMLKPNELIAWADNKILKWPGPPPVWLCDLSTEGRVPSEMEREFPEPSLVERLRILACGHLTGRISISDILFATWILRREDKDATLRTGLLTEPYHDLLMAAREWGLCETTGVNPAVIADWESGYINSWPGGDIADPWGCPNQLDPAGKLLQGRVMRDLEAISKGAGAVLSFLEAH